MSAGQIGISVGQVFQADVVRPGSTVAAASRQSVAASPAESRVEAASIYEEFSPNWMQRLLLRLNGVFVNSSELEW